MVKRLTNIERGTHGNLTLRLTDSGREWLKAEIAKRDFVPTLGCWKPPPPKRSPLEILEALVCATGYQRVPGGGGVTLDFGIDRKWAVFVPAGGVLDGRNPFWAVPAHADKLLRVLARTGRLVLVSSENLSPLDAALDADVGL